MAISQSELYNLARSQGLSDDRAKVAAATSMGESGGNPNAHNTNKLTGDNSYGLWQINMLGAMGPERLKQFGISNNDQLFDPVINAKAMAILSKKGADFSPWSAFNSGSYLKFMGNKVTNADVSQGSPWWKQVLNVVSPISNVADVSNPIDGLAAIGDATSKTAHWVSDSKNWIRVAYVGGGVILVMGALITLASDTSAGKMALKVATKGLGGAGGSTRSAAVSAPKVPGGAARV